MFTQKLKLCHYLFVLFLNPNLYDFFPLRNTKQGILNNDSTVLYIAYTMKVSGVQNDIGVDYYYRYLK